MKKSFVLVSLLFLMVFSACGANGEAINSPASDVQITASPLPEETTSTNDESIRNFISFINSLEDMTAEYVPESSSLNVNHSLPDISLQSLVNAATYSPEDGRDFINSIQELNDALYSRMISDGVSDVTLSFREIDCDGETIALYIDGEQVFNAIALTIDDFDTESNSNSTISEPITIPETIVYTGSGDSVIEVEIASSDDIYVLHVVGNANGNHFAVRGYDASGNSTELFVNTINPYDGYTFDPSCSTSLLEISSTGDWTIELISIYNMQTISTGQTISGTGDSIMMVENYGTTATISGNQGANHFAVKTYGTQSNELLVNTVDPYSGTVMLNGNPVILQVNSEGEWEITFN